MCSSRCESYVCEIICQRTFLAVSLFPVEPFAETPVPLFEIIEFHVGQLLWCRSFQKNMPTGQLYKLNFYIKSISELNN